MQLIHRLRGQPMLVLMVLTPLEELEMVRALTGLKTSAPWCEQKKYAMLAAQAAEIITCSMVLVTVFCYLSSCQKKCRFLDSRIMDTFLVTHFCTLLAIPRCSVCWKSKKISCNVLPCSAWMRLSLSVSLQTNIMLTYTGIACHLSQRIVVYRDISDNMLPSSLSLSWQLGRWSTSSGTKSQITSMK